MDIVFFVFMDFQNLQLYDPKLCSVISMCTVIHKINAWISNWPHTEHKGQGIFLFLMYICQRWLGMTVVLDSLTTLGF